MNRFIIVILCLTLALSFSCFAVNYDAYYYQNEDGSYGHDTEAYEHDVAVEMVETAGIDLDIEQYWKVDPNQTVQLMYYFDYDAFENDYNAIVAALTPVEETPIDEVTPDPYPVEWPDEEVIEYEPETPLDETLLEDTESDPVLELEENPVIVYALNDMRSSVDDGEIAVLDGLKAVIRSVFGTYDPVTTTAVYTETVNGETVTTLVDVVADGSAGVDWEYISGVFIFGIMLFCLFKLLGGIIS